MCSEHSLLVDVLAQCKLSTNTPAFAITVLMLVTPGIAGSDILTQYAYRQELFIWRSLWRDMDDAYTIVVQEVFKFDTPTPIFTCELRESSIDLSASLSGRKLSLVIFARL